MSGHHQHRHHHSGISMRKMRRAERRMLRLHHVPLLLVPRFVRVALSRLFTRRPKSHDTTRRDMTPARNVRESRAAAERLPAARVVESVPTVPKQTPLKLMADAWRAGAREGHQLGARYLAERASSPDATPSERGAQQIEAWMQRNVYAHARGVGSKRRSEGGGSTYKIYKGNPRSNEIMLDPDRRRSRVVDGSDRSTIATGSDTLYIAADPVSPAPPTLPKARKIPHLSGTALLEAVDTLLTMKLATNDNEAYMLIAAIDAREGDTLIDVIQRVHKLPPDKRFEIQQRVAQSRRTRRR